jgi:hypothetical protein
LYDPAFQSTVYRHFIESFGLIPSSCDEFSRDDQRLRKKQGLRNRKNFCSSCYQSNINHGNTLRHLMIMILFM